MMRIFNKNGPLCKNKNNGSNLIVNKNRALCEGKTFKAFTSNALLIALLMLIVMLIPNIVRAEERSIDGVSYTYNVVNGNEAEIITIYPMGSGVTEVIIPNEIEGKTVTSISQDAFRVWNVTKLTIPGTVNTIRQYTFSGLKKLTTVNILDGVTSIGKSAFSGCTALTSITIPNSITSIGDGAFSGCTALESITIPNSVTSIGVWAFSECTALESITILNGVKYIGNEAFVNCYSLSTIEIV